MLNFSLCDRDMKQNVKKSACIPLLVILLLAVVVRVYWLVTQTVVIEVEGAEYARIAENLLRGHGYVGTMEGPQLLAAPLFPLLIAAFSFVARDFELAGRLVSLMAGTCLVVVLFFLARRVYGRQTALTCAILAAFYPFFIMMSAAVYTEATFLTLIMAGTLFGLQAIELSRGRDYVLTGLFFGLAYLTRAEAIAYVGVIILILLYVALVRRENLKRATLKTALVVISFGVLAAPYVMFLYAETGQFRFEGKHEVMRMIGKRTQSGMSFLQAAFGIDANLDEAGPLLNPNHMIKHAANALQSDDIASRGNAISSNQIWHASRDLLRNIKSPLKRLYDIFTDFRPFGVPVLTVLVLMGLFRNPWDAKRRAREGYLLCIVSTAVMILIAVKFFLVRHTFSLLPLLVLWAAKGIEEFSEWFAASFSSVKCSRIIGRAQLKIGAKWGVSVLFLLLTMQASSGGVFPFALGYSKYLPEKEAGLWIKKNMASAKIMEPHNTVSYYADGVWFPSPYADASLALKYIDLKKPDFVVLSGRKIGLTLYMEEWLQHGIPSEKYKLVYDQGTTLQERIMIYQLIGEAEQTMAMRGRTEK